MVVDIPAQQGYSSELKKLSQLYASLCLRYKARSLELMANQINETTVAVPNVDNDSDKDQNDPFLEGIADLAWMLRKKSQI